MQSRERSESFRQESRIEDLEKENQALQDQHEEGARRLSNAKEELQRLKEANSELEDLRTKAVEADTLRAELENTRKQLEQAQEAGKNTNRSASVVGTDLAEQLSSKTSTIESLEFELSKVRTQLNGVQTTLTERDASATDLEERAQTAETATASIQQELDALKVSIAFPSDETKAASEDPEALTKRITVLESDLRTATSNLEAAGKRATGLEQKIEALTKLHRDTTTASQSKDSEIVDLRAQLKRRDRPSHVRDASEFELGEEETETGALQARIRALEAENFDLRRGVWREKRAEMQPGMEDDLTESYEDVDLNGPYGAARDGGAPRQSSTLQDVITSGISAFTGRAREQPRKARKESLGLLSEDDDDFDPDAFRLAHEEDAKRRLERVREVKRGLEKWKGWRVDVAELGKSSYASGRALGPVFEV